MPSVDSSPRPPVFVHALPPFPWSKIFDPKHTTPSQAQTHPHPFQIRVNPWTFPPSPRPLPCFPPLNRINDRPQPPPGNPAPIQPDPAPPSVDRNVGCVPSNPHPATNSAVSVSFQSSRHAAPRSQFHQANRVYKRTVQVDNRAVQKQPTADKFTNRIQHPPPPRHNRAVH
jgi:hypothetical protein